MSSPLVVDVLREALTLLEEEFPVLADPPETTREAAIAVLCSRLRYAIHLEDPADQSEDPFGPDEAEEAGDDWEDEQDDDYDPVGEEWQPFGWVPALWGVSLPPDTPDTDASGRCFSDADPGL